MLVVSWLFVAGLRAESPKPAPIMTTAGAALTNDTFADALPKAWRPGKGTWTCESGVIRGIEVPADKHQAVMRRAVNFKDAIVTFQFRLDQARQISLSINDAKEHVCRLIITPRGFTVQKDDHDHDGPDKAVAFARVPMTIRPGEWHTAIVEMSGPNLVAQIDDGSHVGFGAHDLIDRPKANFGLTVAGGPAQFRELTIVAATARADWTDTKARLARAGGK
jgi:hypothetical protein